jgi:uncharacterized protein YbbC (DUF1343 family)
MVDTMAHVESGLEKLEAGGAPEIRGMRLGLLTNPCGVNRDLRSSIELVHNLDFVELISLFGPEHGIRGEVQAGDKIGAEVDAMSGLPIHSLYGETRIPTAEMLNDIDALVIDLQDIGSRHTTYISSLDNVMTACHEHGKHVVILDRPNPLGGETIQGGLLQEHYRSFIGTHPIPAIHGLTIGEFGLLLAAERGIQPPIVVTMNGWKRSMLWDATRLPWVFPSPNLPTLDSHLVYPGTCLIEGTTLSEGRGTTRPFEVIGAPWIDPEKLASAIGELKLPGIQVRPLFFVPTISKHAGQRCGGIQVYIDREINPNMVEFGVNLLRAIKSTFPSDFAWIEPPKQGSRYFIDLLTGSRDVRDTIDAGTDPQQLFGRWQDESNAFRLRRSPYLLYDSDQ